MPYRLAAGHSGASVCGTCPVEPPSLQRRAMHRLKHGMKHPQVMQARGARCFWPQGRKKWLAKKLNNKVVIPCWRVYSTNGNRLAKSTRKLNL